MPATNFTDGVTVVTAAFLNAIFGPGGHVHDGLVQDGSAPKVDPLVHVDWDAHNLIAESDDDFDGFEGAFYRVLRLLSNNEPTDRAAIDVARLFVESIRASVGDVVWIERIGSSDGRLQLGGASELVIRDAGDSAYRDLRARRLAATEFITAGSYVSATTNVTAGGVITGTTRVDGPGTAWAALYVSFTGPATFAVEHDHNSRVSSVSYYGDGEVQINFNAVPPGNSVGDNFQPVFATVDNQDVGNNGRQTLTYFWIDSDSLVVSMYDEGVGTFFNGNVSILLPWL